MFDKKDDSKKFYILTMYLKQIHGKMVNETWTTQRRYKKKLLYQFFVVLTHDIPQGFHAMFTFRFLYKLNCML